MLCRSPPGGSQPTPAHITKETVNDPGPITRRPLKPSLLKVDLLNTLDNLAQSWTRHSTSWQGLYKIYKSISKT